MPLTKKQKKLIVAGGLITVGGITAYAVAKALAKPTPAPTPTPTPPPEEVPPTYYPTSLFFENPNITLTQLYYAQTYAKTNGWLFMCLGIWPVTSYEWPVLPDKIGYFTADPKLRVTDALGRGVPNITVEVWSSPTSDDQGGELWINDRQAPSSNPVKVTSDSNGYFPLKIVYAAQNCEVIARKHNCQHITPFLIPIGYVGCNGCVPAPDYIGYCNKDIETTPKVYTIIARYPGLPMPQALVTGKLKSHAHIVP